MLNRKLQVFVSSTFEDLKDERQVAVQAILDAGHIPAGMELFRSGSASQIQTIQKWIDESDVYCLILGGRYGSMVPGLNISYIEQEYLYALEKKMPLFAVVLSDRFIYQKALQNPNFAEKQHIAEYCQFKNLVNSKVVRYADDCKDIQLIIQNSLMGYALDSNLKGWVRYNQNIKPLSEYTDATLREHKTKVYYELIKRENDIRAAYDFYDSTDNRFWDAISKQTYIDKFDREVTIIPLPDSENAQIQIKTKIKYNHISPECTYYQSSPRFDTKEQAEKYHADIFQINGKDLSDQIKSSIIKSDEIRQFPYLVKNIYPLPRQDSSKPLQLIHQTTHEIQLSSFFQSYQLIFPCRDFTVRFIIKNNDQHKYQIKMSTLTSFNVHTSKNYESGEMENNDVFYSINIPSWSLPGSGYVASLHLNSNSRQNNSR